MKDKLIIGFVLGVIALAVAWYLMSEPVTQPVGSVVNSTSISAATTSAVVAVTTSTRVLATTTDGNVGFTRAFASICNPSAVIVLLTLDNDKKLNTNSTGGIPIGAAAGYNACFEINDRNLYQGSVRASSTVGSVNVNVLDYVQ